eukprot:gene29748-2084_t
MGLCGIGAAVAVARRSRRGRAASVGYELSTAELGAEAGYTAAKDADALAVVDV